MKNKRIRSIRIKIIAAVVAVGLASFFVVQILYFIAQRLNKTTFFYQILSVYSRIIGRSTVLYIIWAAIFIILLYLLTHRSIKYLEDIVKIIHGMEEGNLGLRADIRTEDELGDLANAINKMVEKLQISMEDERKAEEAKKDLITSVSHDLRTPLTSVIGFLGLLINRGSHSDEDLERYALIAHKKALKLQELIDELFEYTRIGYSSLKVNMARISLTELLGQLIDEFYPLFEENSMEIRTSYAQDKMYIMADGDLIARLFENLINNAIRYGREGKFIDVKIYEESNNAVVEVINYGEIIPKEHLDKLFEKFYRVDISRSRETGGTGLGLAIAKSIVQMHNGSISAASEDSTTCFKVTLPLFQMKGEQTR